MVMKLLWRHPLRQALRFELPVHPENLNHLKSLTFSPAMSTLK
jgi:hypothetical protein